MDTVDVHGLRVAYERAGDGPPLVLLHGFVGDGPTTWWPQLEGLSDEFTVVAWDAPGAGRSTDPPEDFAMSGYADCLAGFVDALDLEAPTIVGLSFGGSLTLEFNRRHPAIPRSLVLVSAYAGWGGSLPSDVVEQRLHQALVRRICRPASSRPRSCRRCSPTRHRRVRRPVRRSLEVQFGPWRASAENLRSGLPPLRDQDVRAPLTVAEDLHSQIAGSTLVVLPGAGHVCNIEAPELFNTAVRDFLRRTARS